MKLMSLKVVSSGTGSTSLSAKAAWDQRAHVQKEDSSVHAITAVGDVAERRRKNDQSLHL